jgi:hypothetical protein
MQPTVRLAFADFWPGFDPQENFFIRLLTRRFHVILDDRPDFLLYSCFGRQHLQSRAIRIFYSGENVRPDFTICDYALTSDHSDHPRHFRLPLYVLECEAERLVKPDGFDAAAELSRKRRFCNFVYSNPRCRVRNRFFRKLSRYRRVDAGGRLYNNLGQVCGPQEKAALLGSCKFTIAFENSSYPGYTTEKIVHAMLARSLPIYWGNPCVEQDFNPASFLNAHDFDHQDELIARVIELDQRDDLYLDYLSQPWFHANRPGPTYDQQSLLDWLEQIFLNPQQPVATQRLSLPQRIRRGRHRLQRNSHRIWRDLTRWLP